MSARLPLDGPSPPLGERSMDRGGHDTHQLSLLDLPGEVILRVLDQLRPTEPVTSYNSTSTKPDVSPDFFQSRASLSNVVLVSRLFYQLGTSFLYRTIILDDQRKVLLFFRTISTYPNRRLMVRSLAWVIVPSTDDTNRQSTILRHHNSDSFAVDCWESIQELWPRVQIDFQVAKIMGIFGPSDMETWRLFGAILALCPRIASLFLFHGCEDVPHGSYMPFSPEIKALETLLWRCEEPDGHGNTGFIGPSGYGFLPDLQHLIVEPHEDEGPYNHARLMILFFLTNSPRLRRVEIKGTVCARGIWASFTQYPNSRLLADNVKELALLRTQGPRDDIMATMMLFPRLVSLQAEYDDASYMFSTRITPTLPFTISSALLRLTETLETLSLTTGPTSYGHWSYVENYPPSLTSLHRMGKLMDLTTESMWLFGRQDVIIALQLPQLLPPNLVRFRLIDYWGTTHTTPPDYHPDTLKYYPDFPNNWSTAEFYYHVLMTLTDEKSPPLPDLREVTLVSKQLCEDLQASDSRGDEESVDLTVRLEEPMPKLRAGLRAVGIHFKLEMPVESEAAARFNWARIG